MISVEHLSKRYGDHLAVDDVSFRCGPGTVTGFLGPNGAGKSTTMRMLCGLTPPTTGSATVKGLPYTDLANPGRHVGVLLDAAAQHGGRTGRETLALSARLLGVDRAEVDRLLALVGLGPAAARRRVGGYSFGMRQRLGVAHALLGAPDVLVLDEPTSGLDPEGIFHMRSLLRDFADRGGTVLLSSHLLREIEAVADRIVMIAAGRVVAAGATAELLAATGTVLVRAVDAQALAAALAAAGLAATGLADGAFRVDAPAEAVGRAADAARVVLVELRIEERAGLEEMFLALTSGGREPVPGARQEPRPDNPAPGSPARPAHRTEVRP